MAILLNMPAIIADATEALLHEWLKSAGDPIAAGEPIAEIETEKATVELEAERDGILARLIASSGEMIAVGAPIAVIAEAGDTEDDIDAVVAAASPEITEDAEAGTAGVRLSATDEPATPAASDEGRIFSSPLARRLAREHGVDTSTVNGSGPGGRIIRKDVEAVARKAETTSPALSMEPSQIPDAARNIGETPSGTETIPLTRMRQAIARRLTESKSNIPHFYLSVDVNMESLLSLRKQANVTAARKITVNDLIVRAAGLALRDEPDANVGYNGDTMFRYDRADISVAIAIDGGLLTPVVRGVDRSSIVDISGTIADYAARAQVGKIKPTELEGGSFTVSNLGMFGTKEFSAILNPPQAGILAVGAAEARAVVVDGTLKVATIMTCTLSADHRVVDGAVAAKLMAAFKRRMENPLSLFI